ncbi:MAG TPA: hypothetical protein VFQ89_11505 [Candidatus Binatia bacterium]|nr:hypothetical protein [Candidatus Binatia bacterium]
MTFDSRSLARELFSFNTINPSGSEGDCVKFLGGLVEATGYEPRFYEIATKAYLAQVQRCCGV